MQQFDIMKRSVRHLIRIYYNIFFSFSICWQSFLCSTRSVIPRLVKLDYVACWDLRHLIQILETSNIFFSFLSSHAQDQWTYFAYLQYIHALKHSLKNKVRKWAWKTRKYILRNLFQKIICTIVVVQTFVTNAVWPPMKNSNSYEPLQWKLWSLFEVMTCPMLTFFSSLGGVVPCVCLQWGYSSVPNRGVGTFIKFDEKKSQIFLVHDLFLLYSLMLACLFGLALLLGTLE